MLNVLDHLAAKITATEEKVAVAAWFTLVKSPQVLSNLGHLAAKITATKEKVQVTVPTLHSVPDVCASDFESSSPLCCQDYSHAGKAKALGHDTVAHVHLIRTW